MTSENQFIYSGHENLLVMQHAKNYNRFLDDAIREYGAKADTVVDFGAGVGALAVEARKWAKRLICVEPDPKQLNILASAGFESIADMAELPDSSVDYIYCINVLEHIEPDREIMASMFRKLRPGGLLFIYVPAFQFLYSSMDQRVGHVRRYSRHDLNTKVSEAGFSIQRSVYVDFLGVFSTLAYKCFGDKQGTINLNALKVYDKIIFPLSRFLDIFFGMIAGKNLFLVCEKS